MKDFAREILGLCRHFGIMERNAICCGDVTVPQCAALQRLLDGALDMSTLAESLGTSVSATTRLVDGLERNGWIERRGDPDDRRRVLIELSPSGEAQARELLAMTDGLIREVLMLIPESKHDQILESLELLRTALDRVGKGGGCC